MKVRFKILGIASIVSAGCLVGISGFQNTKQTALTLANVEALTHWEVTIEYDKCCIEDLNDICVPNYMGVIPGKPVPC